MPNVELPDRSLLTDPAESVSAYLDAGGEPSALAALLYERGWVSPVSKVVWSDMDGDGHLDFSAGLISGAEDQGTGSVFLWRCRDGRFERAEIAPAMEGFGPPALHDTRDLTADRIPEAIIAYPRCGAHTCFARYAVLRWDGARMVDSIQGATDDIPAPELAVESDDPTKPAAIRITAGDIGSVGAGPQRVWWRTWTWHADGQIFVPGEPQFEAPRYRIHALHDADDAYRRGDRAAALVLYQRVIADDELLDWPALGDRRAELSAYAAFRRVHAFLASGDPAAAQAELDGHLAAADPTTAAYAELARRLITGASDGAFDDGCAAATSFVADNADAVLAPLEFGYANRAYAAEDICPMLGP